MARTTTASPNAALAATIGAGTPLDLAANSAFALSVWVNIPSISATFNYICKGFNGTSTCWEFSNTNGTQFVWRSFLSGTGHGVTFANSAFTNNVWAHFYGDYDGSAWHAFVNGTSVGTSTDATGPQQNTQRVTVGALDVSGSIGNYSNLTVADLAVWNGPLTALQITALSRGMRPSQFRNRTLLAWWPLDGLVASEPDLSLNGYNMAVAGGNTPAFAFGPPIAPFTRRWPQVTPAPPIVATLLGQAVF